MAYTAPVDYIYQDDIGRVLEFVVTEGGAPKDISTATVLELRIEKPSGASDSVTPAFIDDGSDGELDYTTAEGDLDEAGTYRFQIVVTMPAGTFHSSIVSDRVRENIEVA